MAVAAEISAASSRSSCSSSTPCSSSSSSRGRFAWISQTTLRTPPRDTSGPRIPLDRHVGGARYVGRHVGETCRTDCCLASDRNRHAGGCRTVCAPMPHLPQLEAHCRALEAVCAVLRAKLNGLTRWFLDFVLAIPQHAGRGCTCRHGTQRRDECLGSYALHSRSPSPRRRPSRLVAAALLC